MNNKKITRQLVWGIVLTAFGVIGIFSAGSQGAGYAILCIAFMAIGIMLLVFQWRNRKKLNEERNQQIEKNRNLTEARWRAEAAKLKAEEAKLKAEAARYNAEAERYEEEANALRKCKNCGAMAKGKFCEYCGSRLVD